MLVMNPDSIICASPRIRTRHHYAQHTHPIQPKKARRNHLKTQRIPLVQDTLYHKEMIGKGMFITQGMYVVNIACVRHIIPHAVRNKDKCGEIPSPVVTKEGKKINVLVRV